VPRCQQHFKDDSPGCDDRPWTSAILLVVMCGLLIRALFLLTCTVVFQDFYPITSDLAPGGMPGWRHDIQVEICADWPAWT